MTKERAAELWPLIKAFSEGKTVQYRDKANILDRWLNLESPSFEDAFEYRIKPEPREFFLRVFPNGDIGSGFTEKEIASLPERLSSPSTLVKVREVLE